MDKLIYLLLIITSCKLSSHSSSQPYLSDLCHVESQLVNYMQEEYGFGCVGTSHHMHEKIEFAQLEFFVPHRANQELARSIVIDAREKYLSLINQNTNLQPYLIEYPFKNAQVSLRFDHGYSWIVPSAVRRVSTYINLETDIEEIVYSYDHLPAGDEFSLVGACATRKEPYKTALLTKSQPNTLNDVHFPGYEENIDEFFNETRNLLRKDHKVSLINAEVFGSKKICRIGYLVAKFGCASKEEARKDLILLSRKITQNINSSQSLRPFLEHFPFHERDISVTIAYRNERFGGHYDGSVCQVNQSEDMVTFYALPDIDTDDFFENGVSPDVFCLGSESLEDAQLLVVEQNNAQTAKQNGLFSWWRRLWYR